MMKWIIAAGFLLSSTQTVLAWQVTQNDDDAFGGKTVQISDVDVTGNGLNVSCDSNKELVVAYIMQVPPSVVDKFAASAGSPSPGELFIKLTAGQPISLQANSSTWNDTHVAFVTDANSEQTNNLAQSLSRAKGKVLVGLKVPNGNKFSTTLSGDHASLVGKAIDACK